MATLFFEAIATAAKRSADTGAGRRRMLSAGTMDLTSAQALQQLVAAAMVAVQQQVEAGQLYIPDPAVLAVVNNAVAALTSIAATAPSVVSVQPTVVDATLALAGEAS